MSFEQARDILEEILVGNGYSTISVVDWRSPSFHDYCLVTQDIVSIEKTTLSELLEKVVSPIHSCANAAELVSKSTVVMRNMLRGIIEIYLETNGPVALTFDDNTQIILTSSTNIVHWQRCLSRSGKDPYWDHSVASFRANSIDVAEGGMRQYRLSGDSVPSRLNPSVISHKGTTDVSL